MQNAAHMQELHGAGLKATKGRIELLHLLEKSSLPLSVETLTARLRLNVVTLYRALEALTRAGLVRKGVGSVARFEYAKRPHHHHLVCSDCGFSKMCPAC